MIKTEITRIKKEYLLYKDISCQEEIGNHFKIDKGSIARSIQKLQEKQFINKEIDENNRRKYLLSLTEKRQSSCFKNHGFK